MAKDQIDWKGAGDETAAMLSDLIRINTVNPPGNETAACRWLLPRFQELGLDPVIVESEPGRGSILGKWRAPKPAGLPLILLSHLDVVPAENEGWTHDPFSGAIADGHVWGRGAVDCKNATAIEWQALKLFKKAGYALKRDVILAATADEETGGKFGVGYLCEKRPELLPKGYCLNEGGGFGLTVNHQEVHFCQTAEKGVCWFKLTADGESGHASIPRPGQAMDRMISALADLRRLNPTVRVSRTVRKLVEAMLKVQSGKFDPGRLTDDQIAELMMRSTRSEEFRMVLQALVRNTLTVTMVHGGTKTNVIPSRVEAAIDCRIVPGEDPDQLLAEIKAVAEPYRVQVETIVKSAATEVEAEGDLYQALGEALAEVRPQAMLAPFMVPGGTDGRFLVERGTKVLGFIPMRAEAGGEVSMFKMAHGVNERTAIADLVFGVQVIYQTLVKFCAAE